MDFQCDVCAKKIHHGSYCGQQTCQRVRNRLRQNIYHQKRYAADSQFRENILLKNKRYRERVKATI